MTTKITRGLLVICFIGCALVQSVYAVEIGKVTRLVGAADATHDDGTARSLNVDDTVHDKDVLRTKSQSYLEVTMVDGSRLFLSENTSVAIKKYNTEEQPEGLLELHRGQLRTFVTDFFSGRSESFKVRTKNTVIDVQGTDLQVGALAYATKVFVYRGVVSVRNRDLNIPDTLRLGAGEAAVVEKDLAPTPFDILTGVEGHEGGPSYSGISSGGLQDLMSGSVQALDPTTTLPTVPSAVPLPQLPNPP
jgi:hypothetical protein